MKPQKLLILGGTGLLGGWISPRMRSLGHSVTLLGRSSGNEIQRNPSDDGALPELVRKEKFDFILNLAAIANVDQCQTDPNTAYLGNVKIPLNVVQAVAGTPTKVVHISTDHLYDADKRNQPGDELPRNTYALSKLAGELALSNTDALILRTNFFGRSRTPKASLADWALQRFRSGERFPIFDDVFVSFVHWSTISAVIEASFERWNPGVFNLGTGDHVSKAEFCLRLARAFDLDPCPARKTKCADSSPPGSAPRPRFMQMESRGQILERLGLAVPLIDDEIRKLSHEYE